MPWFGEIRGGFGFRWGDGFNTDITFEISYDSMDYDFGSFAGESFDADSKDVGGAIGVGIAFLLGPGLSVSLEGLLGTFEVAPSAALVGIGFSLLIGLVIGALPAISAKRLTIVDALRRQ